MRSSYVEPGPLGLVLAALQPTNRLVFEVMLATGLRVGDVLNLRTEQVQRQRFTVREAKTGKTRRVYIPKDLQLRLLSQAGRLYCFEGRNDCDGPGRGRPFGRIASAWRGFSRAAGPCPRKPA